MKPITCFAPLLAAACLFLSCSENKTNGTSVAPKKIMSIAEASAFLKADKDNEGKLIMITAQSCGLFTAENNAIALSLADGNMEEQIQNNNSNSFYACFSSAATEYAKAIPNHATVTISGRIRYIKGKIQLDNCKLIAQN
jgi:hypothetical protein